MTFNQSTTMNILTCCVSFVIKIYNVLQPESRGNWNITYHIKYNGRLNAIFILHCEQILRLQGYYLPASVVKMILHKSSLDYQ